MRGIIRFIRRIRRMSRIIQGISKWTKRFIGLLNMAASGYQIFVFAEPHIKEFQENR